jgi:hypothetical protein
MQALAALLKTLRKNTQRREQVAKRACPSAATLLAKQVTGRMAATALDVAD